ncbi:MAG: ATP-dependent DNA ligase [Flavobacteriales bacterium]|nr:ATP-dependent DNA ligase [Flavobacteriales bacterium]
MKDFARCIRAIDESNKTTVKVEALKRYFDTASDSDKLWCVALLSHRRPKRPVTTTQLREWAAEESGIALWLFEESYHIVGDLAETIALLTAGAERDDTESRSLTEIVQLIIDLKGKEKEDQRQVITDIWRSMEAFECFVFNKILTGSFRIGVSQKLMTKALAQSLDKEESHIAHRLMGNWTPESTDFESLLLTDDGLVDASRPYPFYLAYQLESGPESLGAIEEWSVEWKWDGIRGQIIHRKGEVFIWSRGEELVTDRYPELKQMAARLPKGCVLDGEILPYMDGSPLDFSLLQKRIGRKTVSKKLLEEVPVVFMAYDLLEMDGKDLRLEPFELRRQRLEEIADADIPSLIISPQVQAGTWGELAQIREESRSRKVEGFMLKKKSGTYHTGRVKGEMWKWKVEPYTIDAVLTYAMRGHGRRATLYTDYTFGLWDGDKLVTFAKAYSGLTDEEFRAVDQFIRKNTVNRFGPVREVHPELVFEIAFEGLSESSRHKSGVATRFPRIKRWRKDKTASEANSLSDLKSLILS